MLHRIRIKIADIFVRIIAKNLCLFEHSFELNWRTKFYYAYHKKFYLLPRPIVDHRLYFELSGRSFGERAFHSMWFDIIQKVRGDIRFLEIGVYRGNTISLVGLIAEVLDRKYELTAVSPFSPANDSVSVYADDIDYLEDTLLNFDRVGVRPPKIIRGYSNDPSVIDVFKNASYNLVYIDGNHDYDVVKCDFENVLECLDADGIIVVDDSALNTEFRPPMFASKGHPGPSRVCDEFLADGKILEIGAIGHNRIFHKV